MSISEQTIKEVKIMCVCNFELPLITFFSSLFTTICDGKY